MSALRDAVQRIVHDVIPAIGATYGVQGRARCQVEISDRVEAYVARKFILKEKAK